MQAAQSQAFDTAAYDAERLRLDAKVSQGGCKSAPRLFRFLITSMISACCAAASAAATAATAYLIHGLIAHPLLSFVNTP